MSNSSHGSMDQQNAVSMNGISYLGAAAPQGYGASAPVVMLKLLGRGGATTTLVLGVVLMVFTMPIIFFATMITGVAGIDGNAIESGTTANGSVVTVTADGIFMVRVDAYKDPSCLLTGVDDKSYELESYTGSEDVYLAENLPAGSYMLQCDDIASGANITAFNASPEVVTKVFAIPFVWSIVVGVVGLALLTVGIVLLVEVDGRCHRITQESMLSVVR